MLPVLIFRIKYWIFYGIRIFQFQFPLVLCQQAQTLCVFRHNRIYLTIEMRLNFLDMEIVQEPVQNSFLDNLVKEEYEYSHFNNWYVIQVRPIGYISYVIGLYRLGLHYLHGHILFIFSRCSKVGLIRYLQRLNPLQR